MPTDAAGDRPPVSQVPNFEQVAPGLLRGGQPDADGIAWLEAHSVRTVIDLRGEGGEGPDNQAIAGAWKKARCHSIPIPDMNPPTHEQVEEFLRLVDDPGNQPVFVHCKAGIGRTGTMIACWRVAHGWDVDEAIRQEQFFSYAGSFAQESFVREFAATRILP
ncbi:MAG: tyrosine-protein phosphatase [Armatimonadetes bacterium]|nr:tyrosine-protein phosphatase [Armatimonadota bacterium]